MGKVVPLVSLAAILLAILGGAIACKSGTPTPDQAAVLAYADPAAETTLQGLSEDNLAKYTQYGSAEFKAAVTQDILNKSAAQISSQLGTYVSKEFRSIEEQQGYTIVHYRVQYTGGVVGVRMVFDKDHLVAGQWFEEP